MSFDKQTKSGVSNENERLDTMCCGEKNGLNKSLSQRQFCGVQDTGSSISINTEGNTDVMVETLVLHTS